MKEQEFYKFIMKIPKWRLLPKKYEIYDSLSEKLKFTILVKGYGKFRSFLYDINGTELLTAKKLAWVRISYKWDILKDGKVIATFDKIRPKITLKGYE
ncbi:MAG: hypothetical protein ACXABK_03715, partial [Candidatus Heimdallarchaeaceae archaeon]